MVGLQSEHGNTTSGVLKSGLASSLLAMESVMGGKLLVPQMTKKITAVYEAR